VSARQTPGLRGGGAVPLGVLLIAAGGVLLLDRWGLVDVGAALADWWPLALVALGLWWLAEGARVAGSTVGAIGLLLLGNSLGVLDAPVGDLVLPLVLVVIGGVLIAWGRRLRTAPVARRPASSPDRGLRGREGPGTAVAIFGDAHVHVGDQDGATGPATVDGLVVFGDLRVEVPAGWRVRDRTTALFGEVRVPRDQPGDPGAPILEVRGLVVFGDLEVRHVDVAEVG
jgi:hypothetical protein